MKLRLRIEKGFESCKTWMEVGDEKLKNVDEGALDQVLEVAKKSLM